MINIHNIHADVCNCIFPSKIGIVHIQNDIFTSQNVFLDIQNYIMDIWNGFSFWISEIKIMTSNNWIVDI